MIVKMYAIPVNLDENLKLVIQYLVEERRTPTGINGVQAPEDWDRLLVCGAALFITYKGECWSIYWNEDYGRFFTSPASIISQAYLVAEKVMA